MDNQTPLDVLVTHQRRDISSCLCGWAELGRSFCQHQLDALDAAGFAIVRKSTGDAAINRLAHWGFRQSYYPHRNAPLGWSRITEEERQAWRDTVVSVLKGDGNG